MESLESHLNSLNFSTQLKEVYDLLVAPNQADSKSAQAESKCSAEVTFWGSRVIKVIGYTGSVSITDVANKILTARDSRFLADDLTISDRFYGIEVFEKMQALYKVTDKQIENSNFLTRFLNWIREFSCFKRSTTRDFIVKYDAYTKFRTYSSIENFKKDFYIKPDDHLDEEFMKLIRENYHIRDLAVGFEWNYRGLIDAKKREICEFVTNHPEFKWRLPDGDDQFYKHEAYDTHYNNLVLAITDGIKKKFKENQAKAAADNLRTQL